MGLLGYLVTDSNLQDVLFSVVLFSPPTKVKWGRVSMYMGSPSTQVGATLGNYFWAVDLVSAAIYSVGTVVQAIS